MKQKTKTYLYVVERHEMAAQEGVPIAIFVTNEAADNYAGACEQDFKDKGILAYHFKTHAVMFYNE